MSLDLHPVQVRLCDEAYAALKLLAAVEDKDKGEIARRLLTRILLGEAHAARVLRDRLSQATTSGSPR